MSIERELKCLPSAVEIESFTVPSVMQNRCCVVLLHPHFSRVTTSYINHAFPKFPTHVTKSTSILAQDQSKPGTDSNLHHQLCKHPTWIPSYELSSSLLSRTSP